MYLTLFPRQSISTGWMWKQLQGFPSPLEPRGVGLAASGATVPEWELSGSSGRDVKGSNLFWRWGHTANTVCARPCGFTQAPHAFFYQGRLKRSVSPRGRGVRISIQQSRIACSSGHSVACTRIACCFPPQPPLSNQVLAQVPLPPRPCLASTSFFAQDCARSQQKFWSPLGGSSRTRLFRVMAADSKAACVFHKFFPVGQDQAASQALWRQHRPQGRQSASANLWLDMGTRQMDAMCLLHESSPTTKGPANSGLDICSYVSEILPTYLVVLTWYYLLMKRHGQHTHAPVLGEKEEVVSCAQSP